MSDAGDSKAQVNTKAASDDVLLREEIHEEWEQYYLTPEMDRFYDKAFAEIARRLHAPPGAKLLDAGCGYCFHAVRLARHGFAVTGADFSEAALEQARGYLAKVGMADQLELEQANLLDMPYEDGTWPYVNCWGVLMHIPHIEQALRELARVTAPGGKLVIMENNARSLHVSAWDPVLRGIKGLIGRSRPTRQRTPRGVEMWFEKPGGEMLVRMTDIDFMTRFLEQQGMTLEDRFAGQLTEIYTSVPGKPIKRAIQTVNELWVDHVGWAQPAMGNICIYRKA
ncbi:MAG: methyltransferase domain-containing protein [Deltaproteobacteria bacterium]|nr:methyltransferase domain-containing protein [Deltaproteobacteria bacterium]